MVRGQGASRLTEPWDHPLALSGNSLFSAKLHYTCCLPSLKNPPYTVVVHCASNANPQTPSLVLPNLLLL